MAVDEAACKLQPIPLQWRAESLGLIVESRLVEVIPLEVDDMLPRGTMWMRNG